MKNTKIFEKVIHCLLIIATLLFFVFLTQNHIQNSTILKVSGYELINFHTESVLGVFISLSLLFLLILFSILLIVNTVYLLYDFQLIKGNKIELILKKLNFALGTIILCAGFVCFVCLIFKTAKQNKIESIYSIGWASITNFLLVIEVFVPTLISYLIDKLKNSFKVNKN